MFAQEANMHENKYNRYRIPAGLLITFLEKALILTHMETHLNDVTKTFVNSIIAYFIIQNEELKIC